MYNVASLRHLKTKEKKALMHLLSQLYQGFSQTISHIYLFGSKLRDNSDAESDIDLLIVVKEYSWTLEKEITRLTTQTDYAYQVILSDHIIGNERFEQMAARREPLYCNLEAEGIDLWTLEPRTIT